MSKEFAKPSLMELVSNRAMVRYDTEDGTLIVTKDPQSILRKHISDALTISRTDTHSTNITNINNYLSRVVNAQDIKIFQSLVTDYQQRKDSRPFEDMPIYQTLHSLESMELSLQDILSDSKLAKTIKSEIQEAVEGGYLLEMQNFELEGVAAYPTYTMPTIQRFVQRDSTPQHLVEISPIKEITKHRTSAMEDLIIQRLKIQILSPSPLSQDDMNTIFQRKHDILKTHTSNSMARNQAIEKILYFLSSKHDPSFQKINDFLSFANLIPTLEKALNNERTKISDKISKLTATLSELKLTQNPESPGTLTTAQKMVGKLNIIQKLLNDTDDYAEANFIELKLLIKEISVIDLIIPHEENHPNTEQFLQNALVDFQIALQRLIKASEKQVLRWKKFTILEEALQKMDITNESEEFIKKFNAVKELLKELKSTPENFVKKAIDALNTFSKAIEGIGTEKLIDETSILITNLTEQNDALKAKLAQQEAQAVVELVAQQIKPQMVIEKKELQELDTKSLSFEERVSTCAEALYKWRNDSSGTASTLILEQYRINLDDSADIVTQAIAAKCKDMETLDKDGVMLFLAELSVNYPLKFYKNEISKPSNTLTPETYDLALKKAEPLLTGGYKEKAHVTTLFTYSLNVIKEYFSCLLCKYDGYEPDLDHIQSCIAVIRKYNEIEPALACYINLESILTYQRWGHLSNFDNLYNKYGNDLFKITEIKELCESLLAPLFEQAESYNMEYFESALDILKTYMNKIGAAADYLHPILTQAITQEDGSQELLFILLYQYHPYEFGRFLQSAHPKTLKLIIETSVGKIQVADYILAHEVGLNILLEMSQYSQKPAMLDILECCSMESLHKVIKDAARHSHLLTPKFTQILLLKLYKENALNLIKTEILDYCHSAFTINQKLALKSIIKIAKATQEVQVLYNFLDKKIDVKNEIMSIGRYIFSKCHEDEGVKALLGIILKKYQKDFTKSLNDKYVADPDTPPSEQPSSHKPTTDWDTLRAESGVWSYVTDLPEAKVELPTDNIPVRQHPLRTHSQDSIPTDGEQPANFTSTDSTNSVDSAVEEERPSANRSLALKRTSSPAQIPNTDDSGVDMTGVVDDDAF